MEAPITIISLIIGVAGLIVGIIGIIFAFRERILKETLDRTLKTIEKERVGELWTKIGIDCTAFDALDIARNLVQSRQTVDYEVLTRVENARRATVDLYRLLLKEAVAIERDFNMETIKKWQKAGRLENDWRVRAAMRLLPTDKIPNCEPPETETKKLP